MTVRRRRSSVKGLVAAVSAAAVSVATSSCLASTTEPAAPEPEAWTLKATDHFDGSTLDSSQWRTFTGPCGCSEETTWDSSQVEVSDGSLKLHNRLVDGTWLSGGVGGWPDLFKVKYGKVEARMRTDKGRGHWAAGLTWPDGNGWPEKGELDFYEVFEAWGERDRMRQTLHHGPRTSSGGSVQKGGPTQYADFSDWQVAGVEWTPERVTFTLDGQEVFTVTEPDEAIPYSTMWIGFQNTVKTPSGGVIEQPSDGGPVTFEVDWVKVYESEWSG